MSTEIEKTTVSFRFSKPLGDYHQATAEIGYEATFETEADKEALKNAVKVEVFELVGQPFRYTESGEVQPILPEAKTQAASSWKGPNTGFKPRTQAVVNEVIIVPPYGEVEDMTLGLRDNELNQLLTNDNGKRLPDFKQVEITKDRNGRDTRKGFWLKDQQGNDTEFAKALAQVPLA